MEEDSSMMDVINPEEIEVSEGDVLIDQSRAISAITVSSCLQKVLTK